MHILDELDARGLVADVTDRAGLAELLAKGPVTFYVGYDPTSPSLHVGNLVPIILQVRLQRAGHKPIVLVGGATGMVGDPSGKSAERNLLADEDLNRNLAGIRAQLSRFLDFGPGPPARIIVNNADWTRGVGFLEFLRDIGKYLTINYMMAKDSVRARLERRNRHQLHRVLVHAAAGVRLRAPVEGARLSPAGRAAPISTATSRRAASCRARWAARSSTGSRRRCCSIPPARRWARRPPASACGWMPSARRRTRSISTGSTSAMTMRRACCGCSRCAHSPRSMSIVRTHDADRSQRVAQRELAREMTAWVHGARRVARVEEASRVMFGGSLDGVQERTLTLLAHVVPVVEIARELASGIGDRRPAQPHGRGLEERGSPAVQQGGAYVNNVRIGDLEHKVTTEHLATPTMLVVRGGRKDYRLVKARDGKAQK